MSFAASGGPVGPVGQSVSTWPKIVPGTDSASCLVTGCMLGAGACFPWVGGACLVRVTVLKVRSCSHGAGTFLSGLPRPNRLRLQAMAVQAGAGSAMVDQASAGSVAVQSISFIRRSVWIAHRKPVRFLRYLEPPAANFRSDVERSSRPTFLDFRGRVARQAAAGLC